MKHSIEKDLISLFLKAAGSLLEETFIIKHSVHDWLWGYNDKLLEDIDKIVKIFNEIFRTHIVVPPSLTALQVCFVKSVVYVFCNQLVHFGNLPSKITV